MVAFVRTLSDGEASEHGATDATMNLTSPNRGTRSLIQLTAPKMLAMCCIVHAARFLLLKMNRILHGSYIIQLCEPRACVRLVASAGVSKPGTQAPNWEPPSVVEGKVRNAIGGIKVTLKGKRDGARTAWFLAVSDFMLACDDIVLLKAG